MFIVYKSTREKRGVVVQIAHINKDGKKQSIKEHSEGTAGLASDYSIPMLRDLVYNAALFHDLGKYQVSFQKRINGNKDIKIPHALCGAIELNHEMKQSIVRLMMQYCIAGHHAGLQNFGTKADTNGQGTLCGTLQRETEDYSGYKEDISLTSVEDIGWFFAEKCNTPQEAGEYFAFITRYVYSCLTDADSIDTETFGSGYGRTVKNSEFQKCLEKINEKFNSFVVETELQKARSKVQSQVYQKLLLDGEIFLMNMPTGSGKTLCSMKFALERAIQFKKKRIIYIIPYNSIIDQTAAEFEKVFGADLNILRHQSSFKYEVEEGVEEDYTVWANKAIENWDGDFIITTAVQFFESVYHNKRGKLRKLHNMGDTILIFDEAHLMPIEYLSPCLKAISHITNILNSEAVFLTATMPNFYQLLEQHGVRGQKIVNLIEDKTDFDKFKKCKFENLEYVEIENLLLLDAPSKLIIVNSKKKAREIYYQCTGVKYHLSTYMTAEDRQKTIEDIHMSLQKLEEKFGDDVPEGDKVTVVATSLIEAGVDLDFHVVCRELSGLDHILQAGGRCNREGKRLEAKTYIFQFQEDFAKTLQVEESITKNIIRNFSDLNSSEAICAYYERILKYKEIEIIKHNLVVNQKYPFMINFREYAETFHLINDNTISIVVLNIGEDIEKIVNSYTPINTRKYQKSMASVKNYEFDQLLHQGVIKDFGTGVFFLVNLDYYDKEVGILFEGKDYII